MSEYNMSIIELCRAAHYMINLGRVINPADYQCRDCGQHLKAAYMEEETYLVSCSGCNVVHLTRASRPDDALKRFAQPATPTSAEVRAAIEETERRVSDARAIIADQKRRQEDLGGLMHEYLSYYETILTALEQMQTEPCEWCKPRMAWEVPDDSIYAYQKANALGEPTGEWSLKIYGGDIAYGNALGRPTMVTHCPNCGRSLNPRPTTPQSQDRTTTTRSDQRSGNGSTADHDPSGSSKPVEPNTEHRQG